MPDSTLSFVLWHAKFFQGRFAQLIYERRGTLKAEIAEKLSPLSFFFALVAVCLDIARLIEYPKVLEYLDPRKDDLILDVGCGTSCFPTFICKSHEPGVVVIDIDARSLKMQREARKKVLPQSAKTKFFMVRADARRLPFRNGVFTKVYSISSIEHISSSDDLASVEIKRVLCDDGVCVLSFPYALRPKEPRIFPYYMRWYTDDDISARITNPSELKICEKYLFEKRFVRSLLGYDSYLRQVSLGWLLIHYLVGMTLHRLDDLFLKEDDDANGCIVKLVS